MSGQEAVQRRIQIRKVQGENTRKGKRFTKGRHIRATEMDDSSDEEEDVAESSQSNEEQVIRALMKKLPKEQRINMLINMEQDF
jgi:DNA-directed RNA polymerase specialized sigma24 family protein